MSLFQSFSKKVRNLVGPSTSQKIATTANKALTLITSPIQSIVNFERAQESTSKKGATKLVSEAVINTLGVIAPATTGGRAAITSAAKSLVPKSLAGKAVGAAAIPVVAGAISTSSKAREAVAFSGDSFTNIGSNVGKAIDDPSISSVKNIFAENPVITSGIVLAGVGSAALAASPFIASVANTQALKESTSQIQQNVQPAPVQTIILQQSPITPAVAAPSSMEAPAGVPIKKKAKKKKKKAKKKTKKKTRRSKKKTAKKKKKTIKRKKAKK